jgi:hypothetical protein
VAFLARRSQLAIPEQISVTTMTNNMVSNSSRNNQPLGLASLA